MKMIAFFPKRYGSLIREICKRVPGAEVMLDGNIVSPSKCTHRLVRDSRELLIRVGKKQVAGFHDHPREMFMNSEFSDLATTLERLDFGKIQFGA
jgi:hypothetical protein